MEEIHKLRSQISSIVSMNFQKLQRYPQWKIKPPDRVTGKFSKPHKFMLANHPAQRSKYCDNCSVQLSSIKSPSGRIWYKPRRPETNTRHVRVSLTEL